MKNLLTLFLLLIYTTAFSQVPDRVENDLSQIENLVESIRGHYAVNDVPDEVTARYIKDDQILFEWSEFVTDDSVDIQFYSPYKHNEWQHSVNKYLDLHNTPINVSDGSYVIGASHDLQWKLRLTVGDWESEVITLTPKRGPPVSEEPISTLYGFYDGYRAPENVSLYKTYLGDDKIDEMIDQGKKIALMISGFEKENGEVSDYEIERRWKAQEPALTDKIRDAIAYVYVMDEPYHKGYNLDFQERAIEVGRKIFGDFKYGYSYMEDHVMNKNRPLAKNADFVGVNNYLFRKRSYAERYNNPLYIVESQEDFFEFENELLERIKNKVSNKEILITAQGISIEGQYAEPPLESPFWYAELMKDNPQIKGILYYNWIAKHNESKALEDMPDLYENIQKAFK